jgi:phosphoribosylaminoimidazole-succinocarboxamide synthase
MPEANAVHVASGKVRELYELDSDRLLLTASDRISVFDVVLPTEIPDKGRVLTGLSGYWFSRTKSIVPNHLVTIREDGRSMECKKLLMLPIECVVRGYLSGSGWKSYRERGEVCGIALPEGLQESDRLPEPVFTPTTKAAEGHDEPLTAEQAGALIGDERFAELERISIELYTTAAENLLEKGIILADTKFELGMTEDGTIVLGDEIFTPDSSRFWPADEYAPGGPQPSFDKQFVRDYTESLGWDKNPPGPKLPDEVVAGTRARYIEAFEQITRLPFDEYAATPARVLV